MARMAWAMVLTGLLTGGLSANVIQFAIDGAPIGAGEVVEVMPSSSVTIGIYVAPSEPITNFWVDMVFGEAWPDLVLPHLGGPGAESKALLESGDVRMIGDWDNEYAGAFYDSGYDVYCVGGFLRLDWYDPQTLPAMAAEFDAHIPDVPPGTQLGLELPYGELGYDSNPVLVPATIIPATLRVIFPEPVSAALLAIGGMVALRRRLT